MTLADIGIVAIMGGLLGLDVVSFPQAMLSRPIVACTITAGFLGAGLEGLLLGVLVEAFALETLPVGASRYPEWGSSSAVGGALVASSSAVTDGAMLLAVIATLATAWVGGWSMVQLRRLNARWAGRRHDAVAAGDRDVVVGLQVAGMSADLVRGMLMTAAGLIVFGPLYRLALERWALDASLTRWILIGIAGVTAVGAVYQVFHAASQTRWFFLAGLGAALVMLVVR